MTTYTIQPDWSVLVLEDTEERIVWFRERLPHAVYVETAVLGGMRDAVRVQVSALSTSVLQMG